MNPPDFTRLANNFYNSKGLDSDVNRIQLDADFVNYYSANQNIAETKKKVAFVFICLNPLYWEFAPEMVRGAKQFFLPGHQTDFLFWTDIPEKEADIRKRMSDEYKGWLASVGANPSDQNLMFNDVTIKGTNMNFQKKIQSVVDFRKSLEATIFPTESVAWPYPTLMRYNLFLQQEEKLKEYDYIFYCDIDMAWAGIVGDEILGTGLTAAPHPGYYLRKEYYPPYEPNDLSASYIARPGRVVTIEGKPRFRPEYYAGGFQGGKSAQYLEAMKECKKLIETDQKMGYIPIWNDETAWNKYLSQNPPSVFLTPSYVYPDSLIKEYYEPLWGQAFQPKLITITKWFSLSLEGGQAISKMLNR